MNRPLLTIGIPTYNRVETLKRSLESVKTQYSDKIEVIISENCSPHREEVKKIVEEYASNSKYKVYLNLNYENVGYDRNIKKLIDLANGEYLVYLSDDDVFSENAIDNIIDIINANKGVGVIYGSTYIEDLDRFINKYSYDANIEPGIEWINLHLYDSIAISGLCFKAEPLKCIDGEWFFEKRYIQMFFFLENMYHLGGVYDSRTFIIIKGDGGTWSVDQKNEIKNKDIKNLYEYDSPYFYLSHHKNLIEIIKKFDEENNANVLLSFEKEFNLRVFNPLIMARKQGIKAYKEFWEDYKKLDIEFNWISKSYYAIVLLFGSNVSKILLNIPKSVILRFRRME